MIRRDLIGLKVYHGDGMSCIERIFRRMQSAIQAADGIRRNPHRDYPLVQPKLVHPTDKTVAIYVAAGNEIVQ